MKVIAGDYPNIDGYAIGLGAMTLLLRSWPVNRDTVESVTFGDAGKAYNYAKGGTGIVAGAMIAGPAGALVGGLLPNIFKDEVVRFVITFSDGTVAHCTGSKAEFERALRSSLKPPSSASTNAESRLPPSLPDRDRLRAKLKADREAVERAKVEKRAAAREERLANRAKRKAVPPRQ